MVFPTSIAQEDLLLGLQNQKPIAIAYNGEHQGYIRILEFKDLAQAHQAFEVLADIIPERKDEIRMHGVPGADAGEVIHWVLIPSTLLPTLKRAASRKSNGAIQEEGFVARLDARSQFEATGPRSGSDNPDHPEKSVNTFMTPLSGLIHPFDLCERLKHAGTKASGNKHKYYASTSSYGLRFDSKEAAENAKDIFTALSGKESSMRIDSEIINHQTYHWLKIPSVDASRVLHEAESLSAMYNEVMEAFKQGLVSGDLSKAEQDRAALVEMVDSMGFGDSHLAEEMARRALVAAPVTERQ